MPEKPRKVTEKEFSELLLSCIDETLASLGANSRDAIYRHLEKNFQLSKQDIPIHFEEFSRALESLFGIGSKPLEVMIIQRLHSKMKDAYGPLNLKEFTLTAYVSEVKKNAVAKDEPKNVNEAADKSALHGEPDQDKNFIELLNIVADPVVVVDANGVFLQMNTTYERVMGAKKEEWIGKPFSASPNFPQTSKILLAQNLKKRSAGEQVAPYEVDIVSADGEVRQFEVNAKKIEFQGKPADMVISRDVTQRKILENQLKENAEKLEHLVEEKVKEAKENEEKLRGIFDSSPEGIFVANGDGRITECNQAFVNLSGVSSKSEIIGRESQSLIGEATRRKVTEAIAKALEQGETEVRNVECLLITQKGAQVAVEFSASLCKDSSGKTSRYVCEVKDITERLDAEEKRLASEKKYRLLSEKLEVAQMHLLHEKDRAQNYLEAADVLLLALDTTGKITMLNRKGCSILGCETKDVLGKDWFETFVPEAVRAKRRKMQSLRVAGKISSPEKVQGAVQRTDGAERTIAWRHTLLKDTNGSIIGTLSSGEDVTEQKKIQQALAESEAKFRGIVESSSDVIILAHADGSFSYVSPSFARLIGYPPQEIIGAAPSLIHPDDLEKVKSIFAEGAQGRSGLDFEYRVITKQGKTKWVSHSWSPIFEDGKVTLVSSVIRDISERKKLEEEVRASEEKFRAISTSANDAILLIDDTDSILYWNPAAERIFGYTEKEATGNQLGNLIIPPRGQERHTLIMKELAHSEFSEKHFEFTAQRRSGSSLLMDLSLTKLKYRDTNCMLAVVRDISERKRLENALKQERDMLEDVATSIDAGLGIISRDFRVLYANRLLRQINGDDVENKFCYNVFAKSDKVCPDCGITKIFQKGVASDRHDYLSKGPNGKETWIELIATPVKDKEGNVTAALELAVDVTEKKLMQSSLARYSEKLEELVEKRTRQLAETQAKLVKSERLAAIGELAGMVGHDLRNPLTSIKGATYFLRAKYGSSLEGIGQEMLQNIDNSIEYSNKIINDLLDYSREIKLELSEATPSGLFKTALALLQVQEKIKVVDATVDVPRIRADTGKMTRVFINLIKNAFEAMPQGGTLTVTSCEENENWAITFEDTGVGMSEDTLKHLWTPLFTTKAKGMGFGLSICKRIVEAHGGRIVVASAVNKGTTFKLTLPKNPKIQANEAEDMWVFSGAEEEAVVLDKTPCAAPRPANK
jgi:PAS domain S-box-containing protein